ncbi:MAG TPA: SDR family NAD(P)-dependent oxidoreductase, partial [Bdellovibrionales bacterium]|nr:SDR family NAD(P)-dependent oxidoreductase [Bdellovibrionales bacterium]
MGMLENKVAVVTGAGSGIGRAIAFRFAEEGARVVAADIDERAARETVGYIVDKQRREAMFVKTDSSNEMESAKLVDETVKRFGKLDIAVNNAGISRFLAKSDLRTLVLMSLRST